MKPTVSVIMPAFNSEKYIVEAVCSVQSQIYTNWELLIVDDYSSDNTYELIDDMSLKDARIKVFRLGSNSGPAKARNFAIAQAKGRYIAFLDSDDMWSPNKLEEQLSFMREKSAALTYTGYEKVDESGVVSGRVVSVPDSVQYNYLLSASVIACMTAIYDTEITGKIFMPEISKRQDYGLWLRILKKGYIAYGLNKPLAYLRKRRGSVSSNKIVAAAYVWKIYRDVEMLSISRSVYHFIGYAYKAFVKSRI